TVPLDHVQKAIAFYLENKAEVDEYVAEYGAELALKQARFPGPKHGFRPSSRGRTLSVLLPWGSGFAPRCGRWHEPSSFLRDRVGCHQGSAHPDADFGAAALSNAAGPPSGRRSAGAGSTTTTATPTAALSARVGRGSGRRQI